jgi:hypothetical protein
MNYTSLKANVEEICEQSFTADQHALFAQQAEQKIYNSVQFPALRKSDDGPFNSNKQIVHVTSRSFIYVQHFYCK